MTECQKIFREIAEAYLTPWKERTIAQKNLTFLGICRALESKSMTLSDEFERIFNVYHYWLTTRKYFASSWQNNISFKRVYDDHRGMFCYLMAELSDAEFNKLKGE